VVKGIAADPNGDVLVAGYFHDKFALAGCSDLVPAQLGYNNAFLIKFSGTDGSCVWKQTFPSPFSHSYFNAITVAPNGDAVVSGRFRWSADFGTGVVSAQGGTFDYDMVIARYRNNDGAPVWVKTFGSSSLPSNDDATAVALDANQDVIVAGVFSGN